MINTEGIMTKTKWSIDKSHTDIEFKVRHLMISNIKGIFTEFEASIYTSGDDFLTAEIDFWLNPASIRTGDEKRDEHLKGADFFDVLNHKQITFTGNTFVKVDKVNNYELFGNLCIKGITKQIKLHVEFGGVMKDPMENQKAGFTIRGVINRNDWNLNWNTALEAGGILVSDEVTISCEVELIKKP